MSCLFVSQLSDKTCKKSLRDSEEYYTVTSPQMVGNKRLYLFD